MNKKIASILKNNHGAMFGLDARISLLIFGVLSVVTGSIITVNLTNIRASALADELSRFTVAIEGIHHDINDDLHNSLVVESDENAIAALYDPEYMKAGKPRSRWIGPYIKYEDTTHPKYGQMALTKMQADHTHKCASRTLCYLWLTFDGINYDLAEAVNAIYDGEDEGNPSTEGRVQWTDFISNEDNSRNVILYFRISRAL